MTCPKIGIYHHMTKLPQRKSPRLQGYDYSQSGGYFITICTHERKHMFGKIDDAIMMLSESGQIANDCWIAVPEHYPDVTLGDFVIMPNHMHGILYLMGDDTTFKPVVGHVIRGYKGAVTARIRKQESSKRIVWQSRYYDHVIRDDIDELRIRTYIQNNVGKWADDSLYADS